MSIERTLSVKRDLLKYARRDLNQIFETGKNAVEFVSTATNFDFVTAFKSMFLAAAEHRANYMRIFEETYLLAVSEDGQQDVFPSQTDVTMRNEVNTIYYKIVEFHQTISKRETNNSPTPNTSFTENLGHQSSLNSSLARSRLPKVNIPHFSGVIEQWPKFKQLFDSMIHNNSEIPKVEKFHYLSTSLSGEAQSLISTYTINEENYQKAWDAICKRYDNKRLLADAYIDKILDFNPPKGVPTISSLQAFISNVGEAIASLQSIEIPDEADFVWLSIALRKLDPESRNLFETRCVDKEWPTFSDLKEFVNGRCKVLKLTTRCPDNPSGGSSKSIRQPGKSRVLTTTTSPSLGTTKHPCHCKPSHPLYLCPVFRKKSPIGKREFIKGKFICFNCLSIGHMAKDCPSATRCHTCGKSHHTLLHEGSAISRAESCATNQQPACPPQPACPAQPTGQTSNPSTEERVIGHVTGHPQVILGTAKALILDSNNSYQPVRLLLDCGSQCSLITVDCARRLGLPWSPSHLKPLGTGETPIPKVKGKLTCHLTSRIHPAESFYVEPLVVNTITGTLPSSRLMQIPTSWNFNTLADPNFWEPQAIDFLLGGDLFMKVITGRPSHLIDGYEALPTVFGLVVMGSTAPNETPTNSLRCHCITESPITDSMITQFWETEEVASPHLTLPDPCEEHFLQTHTREESGRYVLALPFKESPAGLEGSMSSALMQYKTLETKLKKNPAFNEKYQEFLQEYLDLGHMNLAKTPSRYVIPHHGVFKSNDPNSKIRVVFNASSKTSNGSLNDKLHVGPKLQRDLTDIILNFRRYKVAVTADLVKMYRQILIRPEDRSYQHILWRPNPEDSIQIFELNTVTYGQACAPYQAIRTLKQLVGDEGLEFPLASRALLEECYVDDVVTGSDTPQEALRLRQELIDLLGKGQFEIHKWSSSCPEFLSSFDKKGNSSHPLSLSPKDTNPNKILGMSWDPLSDNFYYQVGDISRVVTKRGILSVISRLFDPMGYLAPVIFKAKTVMQKMWKSKINWDDEPDPALHTEWSEFSNELHHLNKVVVPRYVLTSDAITSQLLGFCDASQRGFAAVIYLRVVSSSGEITVSLLKAKTRLAPLKTISVPRLELSAAHLLVKLFLSVAPFRKALQISNTIFFTDSTIVLAWLQLSPHLLDTFVANRVSYIITHTEPSQWYHIPSEQNPADISSRGLPPSLLASNTLWWAGPQCLYQQDWTPSTPPTYSGDIPELRSGYTLVIDTTEPLLLTWMGKYSNYNNMLRTLAWILRYLYNLRFKTNRISGEQLSVQEIDSALILCVRVTQQDAFNKDYSWTEKRPLSVRLKSLSAFDDEQGILRVGGRLHNSDLPHNTKFPIILPGRCHLVQLIIHHLHRSNMHTGYLGLQALIRRQFWIFGLRQAIRGQLSKCLPCLKLRARPENPIMGNLPSCRAKPSRPFSSCGVDYAGPFSIKTSHRRNSPLAKAYLCVFVCMSTRAVHLELVSSLSTESFLATLDRFVARRGCPRDIFSDCGTNFVGANNRLQELYSWLEEGLLKYKVQRYAANKGLQWHFNPPHAPHFGGIWEAAVKSAKHLLYKVTNSQSFYFEELTTLFARIEAILNSRPLCPSDDSTFGDILTPGHFLIGTPLVSLPEHDLREVPSNHLSRWQLVTKCVQDFWRRWHIEYLQTLQRRPKWYSSTRPLHIGDLVLVPDTSSAPLQWRIGRIAACHPGIDQVVRVVTVKDSKGTFKHPVHNLVSLHHINESTFQS